ncbi:hypothetical protein ACET3X_008736 [Alternaria dauci]|uniref:Uncharacterized protein n=1 Tax=Alternaria dauci TaxID=48095 RepID=A0ABR3UD52_9PLEO
MTPIGPSNKKQPSMSHPDQIKDRKKQQGIRQHAIRSGIQRSRAERSQHRELFVPFIAKEKRQKQSSMVLPHAPSIGLLDPFNTLCACPERLRNLLRHPSAKQAGEPVFCFEDSGKVLFQGMDGILNGALIDPILFHALLLVLTLAANANVPNVEILAYRGEVLDRMQTAMREPGWKPKVSSITAMLMLIGYEYRTEDGDCDSISTHIRGVQAMVDKFQKEYTAVVGQIQRTLFWQDLLGCFVLGTTRLLSHELHNEWLYSHTKEIPSYSVAHDKFPAIFEDWPPAFATVLQDLAILFKPT